MSGEHAILRAVCAQLGLRSATFDPRTDAAENALPGVPALSPPSPSGCRVTPLGFSDAFLPRQSGRRALPDAAAGQAAPAALLVLAALRRAPAV